MKSPIRHQLNNFNHLFFFICLTFLAACGGGGNSGGGNGGNGGSNPDTLAPTITLVGDSAITINHGSIYTELGATASDIVDGVVTPVESGMVDTDTLGDYTITYTATDAAGNSSQATRTVTVVDGTAPTVNIIGSNTVVTNHGESYIELGATATDAVDENITPVVTGTVNINILGAYTVTYTATDAAGNSAQATRTVTIIDGSAPVISLAGASTSTVNYGSTYTELGASALDAVDGAVIPVVSGSVDVNTVGAYIITYTATDAAGNSSQAARTVSVVDGTAPMISLIGSSVVSVNHGATYTELGVTATDNVDGSITPVTAGAVNANTVGTYIITYTATDAAGNSSQTTRTVSVVDATAPAITLNGGSAINTNHGQSYTELGATATDAVDGSVTPVVTGTVNINALGDYTVTYTATDAAGNSSQVVRIVTVVDGTAPVITITGDSLVSVVQGRTYTELGAVAIDAVDGSVAVVISGTVDVNTVATYSMTYSSVDAAGNSNSVIRTVDVHAPRPFITTWKTDNLGTGNSNTNQITIGTSGAGYDYQIDWGDGSNDINVAGNITHTYASIGTYTISINGDYPQIVFGNVDSSKLLTIEQWGDIQWRSMAQSFFDCSNLVGNYSDSPILSQLTDMSDMFNGATSFNQDVSSWDVSNVANMSGLFLAATSFNQEISNWDVSNVTDMSFIFSENDTFNQDISAWNTSNVLNMSEMFSYNDIFNQDISGWDVSNVTDMSFMFSDNTAFNQDITNWNISSVIDLGGMFYNNTLFNQNISGWNTSSVDDMSDMFYHNTVFNQNIGGWDTSNVTNLFGMFEGATSFDQDISNWSVVKVLNMDSLVAGGTLSVANYDALLLGWSVQALKSNINFDAGNSQYSASSQAARDVLTGTYSWTVTDGGVAP